MAADYFLRGQEEEEEEEEDTEVYGLVGDFTKKGAFIDQELVGCSATPHPKEQNPFLRGSRPKKDPVKEM